MTVRLANIAFRLWLPSSVMNHSMILVILNMPIWLMTFLILIWESVVPPSSGRTASQLWLPTIQWRLKVNRARFLTWDVWHILMLTAICCSLFSVRTLRLSLLRRITGDSFPVSLQDGSRLKNHGSNARFLGLNFWRYVHPGDVRDVTTSKCGNGKNSTRWTWKECSSVPKAENQVPVWSRSHLRTVMWNGMFPTSLILVLILVFLMVV